MTRAWWLVDVEVGGTVLRYAHTDLEVESDEGTLLYRPGLDVELELERGLEEVGLSIVDPTAGWATLGALVEGGRVVIRRWVEGSDFEDATVYAAGLAFGVTHGTDREPLEFTLGKPPASAEQLGVQVPDPLARTGEDTWTAVALVDEGVVYPTLFGTPGNDGSGTAVPVMPVPSPTYQGTFQWVLLDGHVRPGNTLLTTPVRLRNDENGGEEVYDVDTRTDDLGRLVSFARVNAVDDPFSGGAGETQTWFAGWTEGGGVASNVYEVFVFLLERYGAASVDWTRLRRLQDELSIYRVDSWLDDVLENPWEYLEYLVGFLPYDLRSGAEGRYLERVRFSPDGTRVRGSFEEGADAVRVAGRTFRAGELNEFTARYRQGRESEWRGRVVVTGAELEGATAGVSDPAPTSVELVKVNRDARCVQSFARWGLRQAEVLDVDWTWDTGTALALLDWRIERDAVSAWESDYWLEGGHDLEVGDEVLLTDSDFGLEGVTALVMTPPVANRTAYVLVTLRYRA